jgi:flagellar basal-body rod protein FlgB
MDIFQGSEITPMSRALDVLAARQRVIANNVANVTTPGYRTQDIAFSDVLKRLFDGEEGTGGDTAAVSAELKMLSEMEYRAGMHGSPGDPAYRELMDEIRALKQEAMSGASFDEDMTPFIVKPDGDFAQGQVNDVEADEEMSKLAETGLMYQVYIQALVKQIGRLRVAVNDRL